MTLPPLQGPTGPFLGAATVDSTPAYTVSESSGDEHPTPDSESFAAMGDAARKQMEADA